MMATRAGKVRLMGDAAALTSAEARSASIPALELRDLSFSYAGSTQPALQHLSFSLPQASFALLCGETGSGKSTLLRAFKPELEVAGEQTGSILLMGEDPRSLKPADSARRIGFVMQDVENQLVTDTVWHELAFGLENIGTEPEAMRRRVAETAHFFGIGAWFERKVADLSGGQKQLLNLASIVVMQPSILLLDEPTSQLDPIAAKDFLDVLGRVNKELGITVLMVEHRLEDVLPMADVVVYLETGGRLAFNGSPQDFMHFVQDESPEYRAALPAATRMAIAAPHAHTAGEALPMTVRDGRVFLQQFAGESAWSRRDEAQPSATPSLATQGTAASQASRTTQAPPATPSQATPSSAAKGASQTAPIIYMRDVWFRYGADDPFVLRGIDLALAPQEIVAVVGGNGAGKSTLLGSLAGIRKPYRGSIDVAPKTHGALLAQDPKLLFVHDSLWASMLEWADFAHYGEAEVRDMLERFGLSELAQRHPFDLSGGEMQKAALAKILLLDPDVLLLDEPVKSIDAATKTEIGRMLVQLAHEQGKTIVLSTHDLEFVADFADSCAMLFAGQATCVQETRRFFQDNLFYSTATARITQGILDGCITTDDVVQCWQDYAAPNASTQEGAHD